MVLVVIPNSIAIKVSRKYTNLRRQRLRSGSRKPYSIAKLRANIANALSINGDYIDPHDLKEPLYSLWITNKYKVLPYNHWFYAVKLMINANGETIARVVDALYEGDYHNDTMKTRPFRMDNPDDKSNLVDWKEYKIKSIIRETIEQYLKQHLI
jgi:hypothetical protein